jgi:2-iminobutanoate/2-iminopropanoate deaminase
MIAISDAPNAPRPIAAYSQATVVNGLVFCAGQIALDPDTTTMIPGGIKEQTEQVVKNLEAVLTAAGSSWKSVLMTSTFLTDLTNSKLVNEIYAAKINPDAPPARQTIGVKELPLGALVEISVIAAVENL